ncbi:MAG: hypothetical protein Q9160_006237 [Pyrenula sp. 1 TL-2023]
MFKEIFRQPIEVDTNSLSGSSNRSKRANMDVPGWSWVALSNSSFLFEPSPLSSSVDPSWNSLSQWATTVNRPPFLSSDGNDNNRLSFMRSVIPPRALIGWGPSLSSRRSDRKIVKRDESQQNMTPENSENNATFEKINYKLPVALTPEQWKQPEHLKAKKNVVLSHLAELEVMVRDSPEAMARRKREHFVILTLMFESQEVNGKKYVFFRMLKEQRGGLEAQNARWISQSNDIEAKIRWKGEPFVIRPADVAH